MVRRHSTTTDEGLRTYRIGPKARALRLRRKMGLVELGRHTGLSAALLSKVERGQIHPTLPTLLRIAMVFGVGLDYFFTEERTTAALVRSNEREHLPEPPKAEHPSWRYESLDYPATDRNTNAWLATFTGVQSERHQHEGSEFLYLISGRLRIVIGEGIHELEAGDSIYFEGDTSHSYCGLEDEPCRAVVVTAT